MSYWRPIETAPKDGTWVLLFSKVDDCGFDWYAEWCPSIRTGRYYEDHWFYCEEYSIGEKPTHWMPLPPPPGHHYGFNCARDNY